MIGYLCGTARGTDLVVCGGVGYRVATPTPLTDGDPVELHVVTVVREDALDLFGFPDAATEQLFRALVKASGVGPKLALTLIGNLGPATVARAVADGDHAALARCRGVGAKVAEKLCVSVSIGEDLLAALGATDPAAGTTPDPGDVPLDDVAAALVQLGYPTPESVQAAADVRTQNPDTDDEGRLVRLALAALA